MLTLKSLLPAEHDEAVFVHEGRRAGAQLVDEDAQGPPEGGRGREAGVTGLVGGLCFFPWERVLERLPDQQGGIAGRSVEALPRGRSQGASQRLLWVWLLAHQSRTLPADRPSVSGQYLPPPCP